jgi:hypothetical protein
MALTPRDVPITREQVQGWINDWAAQPKQDRGKLKTYIRRQVDDLNLPDPMVNTFGHDTLGDSMNIGDFIVLDLDSYRVPDSN